MDFTSELKCNESILELSKEDLQSELLKCRSSSKVYQQIVEDKNQEVYVLKRQIDLLKTQELEFQQEIEHISTTETRKLKGLQDRIHELELINNRHLENDNEEIERLKSDCEVLERTVAELGIKENVISPSIDKSEFDALSAENETLNANYNFAYNKYASTLTELQQSNELIKKLTEEREETQNTYAFNSAEMKAKLDEQEEQIALLRIDLSNAQITQQNQKLESHESRGNSMFSEVYDNWNRLKKKNDTLVEAYKEARQERNKLRNEASTLRRENASLTATWKTECIEAKQIDTDLINTYKFANEKLQGLVQKYEEDLAKERINNYSSCDKNATVYINMIKSKNEQIGNLYKEFRQANGFSITHRLEVREVNDKARKYLAELMQYKSELEVLRDELHALQQSHETIDGSKNDKDVSKSASANKSNSNIDKEVLGGPKCTCKFRKPLCDATTMTEQMWRLPQSRTVVKPCFRGILRPAEKSQTDTSSFANTTQGPDSLIDETMKSGLQYNDNSAKENDLSISNIFNEAKSETKKVQFADSISESSFVNQQRRKPRPTGLPGDLSKMIVVKRQIPK